MKKPISNVFIFTIVAIQSQDKKLSISLRNIILICYGENTVKKKEETKEINDKKYLHHTLSAVFEFMKLQSVEFASMVDSCSAVTKWISDN